MIEQERGEAVKRAAFIGRWQPCHLGHEWLIRRKLSKGVPCLILVRDIEPDEKNPYTTAQTVEMLQAAFGGEDVAVQVIPDIESINWGRGVGYETNEHPAAPMWVSGTEIRGRLVKDWPIDDLISPAVEKVLRGFES